jgi:hypothetical protein
LGEVSISIDGPCALVRVSTTEAVRASATVGQVTVLAEGEGELELGIRRALVAADPDEVIGFEVRATDLAGNVSTRTIERAIGEVPWPALVITEVLANPAGPEPHQEFVELYNAGDDAAKLDGLWLSDLPWPQVLVELASGRTPGDPLPAGSVAPGRIGVVVGSGYEIGRSEDPGVEEGAELIVVEGSLASSGLKNAGEPLSLYRADPPVLVASYGNFVDSSATAHGGRSVALTHPDACDVPSSWRSHPLGRSTPGRLP